MTKLNVDCGIENSILSMLSLLIFELCLFMKENVPMLRKCTLKCLGVTGQVSPSYSQMVQEKIVCVCVYKHSHMCRGKENDKTNGQNVNN